MERSAQIAYAIWASGGEYLIENPVDRAEEGTDWYSERWAEHAPLWVMEEIKELRRRTKARMITFAQCHAELGSKFQKYTSILTSDRLEPHLRHMNGMRCECPKNVKHEGRAVRRP